MANTETYPDGAAQLDAKELGVDPEELWQTPISCVARLTLLSTSTSFSD
jgi:hypothetical protein